MFNIDMFEDAQSGSLCDFILDMDQKALTSKAAKNWVSKYCYTLSFLKQLGTECGEPLVKPMKDGIWELRVGKYRILFWIEEDTLVLSHVFYKDRHKEIEKAKKNREKWKSHHE